MKFTIITVSYNSREFIRDAIDSVMNQDYEDFEYIIIDGNSKDGTQDVLRKANADYKQRIHIVSEPDDGIYHAMNKGIERAKGDVIGFLNADDVYEHRSVLSHYAEIFSKNKTDIVFADLQYVDRDHLEIVKRHWKSGPLPASRMRWGWHPAHPTFYARTSVFKRYGVFRQELRIAADYELMLRFIQKYKVPCSYLPESVVRMRIGGKSNQSLSNILKANYECASSWTLNSLVINPLTIPLKLLWKVKQCKF